MMDWMFKVSFAQIRIQGLRGVVEQVQEREAENPCTMSTELHAPLVYFRIAFDGKVQDLLVNVADDDYGSVSDDASSSSSDIYSTTTPADYSFLYKISATSPEELVETLLCRYVTCQVLVKIKSTRSPLSVPSACDISFTSSADGTTTAAQVMSAVAAAPTTEERMAAVASTTVTVLDVLLATGHQYCFDLTDEATLRPVNGEVAPIRAPLAREVRCMLSMEEVRNILLFITEVNFAAPLPQSVTQCMVTYRLLPPHNAMEKVQRLKRYQAGPQRSTVKRLTTEDTSGGTGPTFTSGDMATPLSSHTTLQAVAQDILELQLMHRAVEGAAWSSSAFKVPLAGAISLASRGEDVTGSLSGEFSLADSVTLRIRVQGVLRAENVPTFIPMARQIVDKVATPDRHVAANPENAEAVGIVTVSSSCAPHSTNETAVIVQTLEDSHTETDSDRHSVLSTPSPLTPLSVVDVTEPLVPPTNAGDDGAVVAKLDTITTVSITPALLPYTEAVGRDNKSGSPSSGAEKARNDYAPPPADATATHSGEVCGKNSSNENSDATGHHSTHLNSPESTHSSTAVDDGSECLSAEEGTDYLSSPLQGRQPPHDDQDNSCADVFLEDAETNEAHRICSPSEHELTRGPLEPASGRSSNHSPSIPPCEPSLSVPQSHSGIGVVTPSEWCSNNTTTDSGIVSTEAGINGLLMAAMLATKVGRPLTDHAEAERDFSSPRVQYPSPLTSVSSDDSAEDAMAKVRSTFASSGTTDAKSRLNDTTVPCEHRLPPSPVHQSHPPLDAAAVAQSFAARLSIYEVSHSDSATASTKALAPQEQQHHHRQQSTNPRLEPTPPTAKEGAHVDKAAREASTLAARLQGVRDLEEAQEERCEMAEEAARALQYDSTPLTDLEVLRNAIAAKIAEEETAIENVRLRMFREAEELRVGQQQRAFATAAAAKQMEMLHAMEVGSERLLAQVINQRSEISVERARCVEEMEASKASMAAQCRSLWEMQTALETHVKNPSYDQGNVTSTASILSSHHRHHNSLLSDTDQRQQQKQQHRNRLTVTEPTKATDHTLSSSSSSLKHIFPSVGVEIDERRSAGAGTCGEQPLLRPTTPRTPLPSHTTRHFRRPSGYFLRGQNISTPPQPAQPSTQTGEEVMKRASPPSGYQARYEEVELAPYRPCGGRSPASTSASRRTETSASVPGSSLARYPVHPGESDDFPNSRSSPHKHLPEPTEIVSDLLTYNNTPVSLPRHSPTLPLQRRIGCAPIAVPRQDANRNPDVSDLSSTRNRQTTLPGESQRSCPPQGAAAPDFFSHSPPSLTTAACHGVRAAGTPHKRQGVPSARQCDELPLHSVEHAALTEAITQGDHAVVLHLFNTKPFLMKENNNLLHTACAVASPDPEVVQSLLRARPELARGVDLITGNTALHFACAAQRLSVEVVKLLLVHGTPAESLNRDGLSAFHVAVLNVNDSDHRVKDALLSIGDANVDERTANGETALHLICGSDDNMSLVRYLVARGADPTSLSPLASASAVPIIGENLYEVTPAERSRLTGALRAADYLYQRLDICT